MADKEKPLASLEVAPERFPLSIQAIHPSGRVVYSKTLNYPVPGTSDVLKFPELGERVTLRITFADGEVAVYRDVFIA